MKKIFTLLVLTIMMGFVSPLYGQEAAQPDSGKCEPGYTLALGKCWKNPDRTDKTDEVNEKPTNKFMNLSASDQEMPSTLTCTSNAKAARDYGLSEKVWRGQKGHMLSDDPSQPFEVGNKDSKNQFFYTLRDKVFSGLNTNDPMVLSITKFVDGEPLKEDFDGIVVQRTSDAVFLIWRNPYRNKLWSAVVDLAERKAIVAQVYQGLSSLGGEVETLDCR